MTEPLRYTLRLSDYWAFHCLSQFCSPITQLLLVLCSAAFGRWAWLEGEGLGMVATVGLAAYAAFWLLQCLFNALHLASRNNCALLAAHTVSTSPEGLRDSTESYDCLYRWRGMSRVADYGVVVAVYTSAVDAVVLPGQAFTAAAQRREWVAQLRACCGKA